MTEERSAAFEFTQRTRVVVGPSVWLGALADARRFGRKMLLVTGRDTLSRLDLQRALADEVQRLGLSFAHFTVAREPDVELADRAAAEARSLGATVVLGLGGGSALDVAKAAAALAVNPGSARDYLEGMPGGAPKAFEADALPVICVPTTAGTGSEVTKNAVLQVVDLQVKRSMRADSLFPKSAFVDPTLSAQAPLAVRAGTGFDALTHLCEAFCSRNASLVTDALARDGIPRAYRALRALANGNAGEAAASDLCIAATLGGICLANAGLGAAHGLVAPLGGLYPLPHGAALACLLPATLIVNNAASAAGSLAEARLLELAHLLSGPAASVPHAAQDLRDLRKRTGLRGLADYGSIDVARVVASPSGSLKTNPVALSERELAKILELALSD